MVTERPPSGVAFRLAAGVELIRVEELPAQIRDGLDPGWGQVALVRAGARAAPLLIDEETAALVEEFRQPSTLAESLMRFSRRQRRDPREVLDESLPVVQRLLAQRFLVAADSSEDGAGAGSGLDSGDRLEELEIVRPVQRLEDMEVFQVRLSDGGFGALKIAGITAAAASERLRYEARILDCLAPGLAPEVLGTGEHAGRPYLVLAWKPGSNAHVVTGEWRHRHGAEARHRLLRICCRILGTYADLHRGGVVHGDINGRNIAIDRDGETTLLDFEDARQTGSATAGGPPRDRAGVAIYFEPEYARAVLADEPPPFASEAGEQYALAALVYELIAGVPYLDFDLRWRALLEQIVDESPSAFADRGLQPWSAVEEVLQRALSKEPERRFPSVAAMVEALARAQPSESAGRPNAISLDRQLEEVIRLTVEKAAADGPWMAGDGKSPARASVYEGAAGVALALLRMSLQREDEALLELADVWMRRAAGIVEEASADSDSAEASMLVGGAGIGLVEVMIATELAQPDRRLRALESSLQCLGQDVERADLYDGASSRLLALCFLLARGGPDLPLDHSRLVELGERTLGDLWIDLTGRSAIAHSGGDLGMAHGWAGFLFATLRWCRSVGTPVTTDMERRLDELADQRVPNGRGLMWPWRLPLGQTRGPQFMAGWCNGSAGYVFLWTAAAQVLGDDSHLDMARGAAWNAWESAQREGSLCCGLVGRAYALLELFRVTGESVWLDRACDLASFALQEGVFEASRPEGLFQGELGLALLAADLQRPERAWLPFLSFAPASE